MNILKSTIRIVGIAMAMLTAGKVQAADAAQAWQKGPSNAWFVKWDEAVAEAKKTGKPIFVLKTGSDWCGWCIRLHKNVLSKPEFATFAKKNLVLLYLDSPSKTPLCAEQMKHNQEVSRKLSLGGGVPNASIVTADGKKLGSISGGGLGLEDYLKKLEGIIGKNSGIADEGVTSDSNHASQRKIRNAKSKQPRGQGVQKRLPTSVNRKSVEPKSETVDGVKWFYETILCGDQTCAKIIRSAEKYVGDIVIPLSLGGYAVACVGEGVFVRCSGLTSVTIPSSVKKVEKGAFALSGLTSVTIPDGVTSIGEGAFGECNELKTVSIPASVTEIASEAFHLCSGLASISVASGNPMYRSIGGMLCSKDGRRLLVGINGEVTIPTCVAHIAEGAFAGRRGLKSVVIPKSVSDIGEHAFHGCNGLKVVNILSPDVRIGEKAFADCRAIASVTIPNTLYTRLGYCFTDSFEKSITDVSLLDGVKEIRGDFFSELMAVKSLSIPSSVTNIHPQSHHMGGSKFGGCPHLEIVYVGKGELARVKDMLSSAGISVENLKFLERDVEHLDD